MTTAFSRGVRRCATILFTSLAKPAVTIPVAAVSVCLLGAVAADMSRAWTTQRRLQNIANVSALAAATQIRHGTRETSPTEQTLVVGHVSVSGNLAPVAGADVAVGVWDPASRSFTKTAIDANAARATIRSQEYALMRVTPRLMRVLGMQADDVVTTATAAFDSPAGDRAEECLPRIVE